MYTRRVFWGAMATALGGVIIWLSMENANAQNPAPGGARMETPAQRIDQKARAARADDQNSIRAVADEIFGYPAHFPPMPAPMETVLKDRLVRAEIAYLKGTKPGVHEKDVVRLVNFLADRLGAPPYAKTSARQVRVLRMALALRSPIFMTRGMTRAGMQVGESINSTMSPLQAGYLLKAVIDQKLWDPDYQLTPAEWDEDQHAKAVERWRMLREKIQSGELRTGQPVVQVVVQANPKHREMQEILSQSISSMGLTDALDLLDQASAILGIEK